MVHARAAWFTGLVYLGRTSWEHRLNHAVDLLRLLALAQALGEDHVQDLVLMHARVPLVALPGHQAHLPHAASTSVHGCCCFRLVWCSCTLFCSLCTVHRPLQTDCALWPRALQRGCSLRGQAQATSACVPAFCRVYHLLGMLQVEAVPRGHPSVGRGLHPDHCVYHPALPPFCLARGRAAVA